MWFKRKKSRLEELGLSSEEILDVTLSIQNRYGVEVTDELVDAILAKASPSDTMTDGERLMMEVAVHTGFCMTQAEDDAWNAMRVKQERNDKEIAYRDYLLRKDELLKQIKEVCGKDVDVDKAFEMLPHSLWGDGFPAEVVLKYIHMFRW